MEIPARHSRKGDCIIRGLLPLFGRIKVLVDYPGLGLVQRPEFLDELVDRRTGGPITLKASLATPAPTPAAVDPKPTWQEARQTLLALRLGQPTYQSVSELSVGMEEVRDACKRAIERAQTGQIAFLLFESPYGMGKSHALGFLKVQAQGARMAAASVVLDGTGVSLCLPMSLIGALAHTVEYPETAASDGLPQRLAELVRKGEVRKLKDVADAEFLYGALASLAREHVEDPDTWEVVEDYLSLETSAYQVKKRLGVRVQALAARFLHDRPERAATLLREWAQACVVTGAPGGLVVLLDEADVDYGQPGRTQTELGQRAELLRALRWHADRGPRAGSYGRLVVAMAITPGASAPDPIQELRKELGLHLQVVRLRELSMGDLKELGGRVARVYQRAYQVIDNQAAMDMALRECLEVTERQAEGRNPRQFLRRLLDKLDVSYG